LEGFPAFLALFLDITRYAEGGKLNRMAAAKNIWDTFAGGKLKLKELSPELQDKIKRINEGAPEELCPCGQALLFTKPFGQLCSEACRQRFCPKCLGPRIEVEDAYTRHQSDLIHEAHEMRMKASRLRTRARYQAYVDMANELRDADPTRWPPSTALDVYASLNGLCCRSRGIHGRNLDGRPWCTEVPWCKEEFAAFGRAFSDVVGRGTGPEAWRRQADNLQASAKTVYAQVGPMPTMMVCEPCAAERKRDMGHDYVHNRIQDHHEQAAKRRRVD